jgi:hypothetical protein
MSGLSIPVQRPTGRAIVVGNGVSRAFGVGVLEALGYQCFETESPYEAMMELAKRPMAYRGMTLSLNSLYREELPLIAAVKGRYPGVEIWLTQADGRTAALAEALKFGADGLLAEDGLHRLSGQPVPSSPVTAPRPAPQGPPPVVPPAPSVHQPDPRHDRAFLEAPAGEPILTADELRALLQEPH